MEVIESVIRDARGHSVDLRCGFRAGEGVTDLQRNFHCPVAMGSLDIKPWIKFTSSTSCE
jgi:hypothetical protein